MDSTHADIDTDMKNMVKRFRVAELQVLLRHAGRSKSGRKHELMTRALHLIESSGNSQTLQEKILDLYSQRFPLQSHLNTSQYTATKRERVKDASPRMASPHHANYHDSFREKYQQSNVKFKELPFYEYMSEILPPMSMTASTSRPIQDSTFKFRINSQQELQIRSGTTTNAHHQEKYNVQIQLRFCLLDTSCEQDDVLPPNLSVKINRCSVNLPQFIPPTKSGQEPKRVNQPLNITSYCRLLTAYEEYTLEVKWSPENPKTLSNDQSYGVVINLVQQLNVHDLMRKLNQAEVVPSSVSRAAIKQKLSPDLESDIATTSLKVSLYCPLGKMRMKLPTRPLTCQHLQCFDATFFLMMNEKKPTWTCPVCDRPADFSNLAVDGLFLEILNNSGADEIEFTEDGNWHSAKKKTETYVLGGSSKPIDLSSTACKQKDVEQKSETIFIDLTGSGDEDDDKLTRTPPPRSPVRASNGTPMSVSSSPIGEIGSPSMKTNKPDVLANYVPTCRKSPREKTYSPARTPYHRSDSPNYAPLHSTLSNPVYSPSPEPYSLNNPPSTQASLATHVYRFSRSGVLDTPPNPQALSPLVSGSPGLGRSLQPPGPYDTSLDGYQPPMSSFTDPSLPFALPRSSYDMLQRASLINHFLATQTSQLYMPLPLAGLPPSSMDFMNRETPLPGSSSSSRVNSNSQQNYQSDDITFPLGAIPID